MIEYLYDFQKIRRCLLFKLQVLTIFIFFAQTSSAQENKIEERLLTSGVKIERTVACQELHRYVFELKRGQVLRINFLERGADVLAGVWRVADNKKVSAIANSGTGFLQENLTVIGETDGNYILDVRAEKISDFSAGYELSSTLINAAALSDKQRVEAENLIEQANSISANNDIANYPSAIENLKKSRTIYQNSGDKYQEAIVLIGIAAFYSGIGNFNAAEPNLVQALNLLDKIKNKAEIGYVYIALGMVYISNKNEVKARTYINNALEILGKVGDKRSEQVFNQIKSRNLFNLESESEQKGLSDYLREINDAKSKGDEALQLSLWGKSVIAYSLGGEEAEYGRFLKNFRGIPSKEVIAQYQIESQKNAVAFYERAESEGLNLARKLRDKHAEMQIHIGLGIAYIDFLDGEDSSDSEDETEEESEDDAAESPIAVKAKSHLIKALILSKTLNDIMFESFAYAGLSGLYMENEEDKLALFFGKRFINSIQNFRQNLKNFAGKETQQLIGQFSDQAYSQIAPMLAEEGRFEETIQILNLSRDQEFFDFKLIDCQPPTKVSLTENEKNSAIQFDSFLNDVIRQYATEPNLDYISNSDSTKLIFNALEKKFDDDNKSENDIVRNVKDADDMKTSLEELYRTTGKNHVTIYVIDDDDTYKSFLLVTRKEIKFFNSGVAGLPEEYVQNRDKIYADFLTVLKRSSYDPRPLGSLIYKSIFKNTEYVEEGPRTLTLEAALDNYKTQVIHWSLSGKMRYIPIAALYDEERRQYLVEQYENVVFTRAKKESFLIPSKRWEKGLSFATTPVIRVANSDMEFSDLPAARNEVFSILGDQETNRSGFFSGKTFIDKEFTRDTFFGIQQIKPDFIHIASHFHLEAGDAGKSFLPLVDGSVISLIDLQKTAGLFDGVDLLTLSACDTAAENAKADGKEIDGLAEIAQRLKAKSVMATLWKVKDQSTSDLMTEFYRLKQENPEASKAEILRLAQMSLLNGTVSWDKGLKNRVVEIERGGGVKVKGRNESVAANELTTIPFNRSDEAPFAHPHYWAPFVLYGGSNGGKLSKPYIIPQPPPRIATNDSNNFPPFGNNSSSLSNVTLSDIETSFNSKLYDETIRLGNAFLQSTPDSKEANAYIGVSYLIKRDSLNAANFLEKAIKLGQPVPIPMKRLRIPILGHAFEDARIIILSDSVIVEDGGSSFSAKYSDLTDFKLNTYYANFQPQCGIVHLKGTFTEIKKKSEKQKMSKKQFDLFPMSAYLVTKQSGQLVFNEAACNNLEDFVPATIISLISRLK